jgi:hypothetical protein
MDKKIAGLLGAAAALTTMTAAQAAVPTPSAQPAPAQSYADLLVPVANPVAALKADDAQPVGGSFILAKTVVIKKNKHHHHHHHHHHHGKVIVVPHH